MLIYERGGEWSCWQIGIFKHSSLRLSGEIAYCDKILYCSKMKLSEYNQSLSEVRTI